MMKILVCGATGLVGRHITQTLQTAGHEVLRGVRKPRTPNDIVVDYTCDIQADTWLPKLAGVEAVINAVGVLRDTPKQPMLRVLEQTPIALFSACQTAGVKKIVQISALGVDQGVETTYFQTRRAPEAFLRQLPDSLRYLILRPSVIYAEDGPGAKMFRFLASLPVHGLPGGGKQRLQPVHIDDISDAVNRWLIDPAATSQTVAAVGLEATDMRGMLDSYRQQLQHSGALHISIPTSLVKLTATLGDFIPTSPLCSDTLKMLNAGNAAGADDFKRLLGRPPRSYKTFISD